MIETTSRRTHYTQLDPGAGISPLAEEWATYCRVVGDLLAAGHEGKHVLIKGSEVIGLWATHREAHREGITRFPGQPILVQEVREWEPVNRFGWLTFGKLLKDGDHPCHG